VEEEQWIKGFNLKEQPQQTSSETRQEKWELWMKEEEFRDWKNQRSKNILFLDGASKGNLGEANGGWILLNPDRKLKLSYAWELGVETNNQAKSLALWQGLNKAISKKVKDLVIIGDSKLIIQALALRNPVKQINLQHILEKIQLLLKRLRTYQMFHVLQNSNEQSDAEANRGVISSIGEPQVNGITSFLAIP
jgi:ribonuclease HI